MNLDERIVKAHKETLSITEARSGAPMLTDNPFWFKVNGEDFYITLHPEATKQLIRDVLEEVKPEYTIRNDMVSWEKAKKDMEAKIKELGL